MSIPYHSQNRKIGAAYEEKAAAYLKEQGYHILAQNFICRQGELDIVAKDKEYLVFVEVKYRKSGMYGQAIESISYQKMKRIYATARYYMYCNNFSENTPCRFDVIAFENQEMIHIKDAFW